MSVPLPVGATDGAAAGPAIPAGIAAASRRYAPGEAVVRAGEPGREMFVVLDGAVEVLGEDGAPLARLGTGEIFGEVALVDGGARTRTVRAAGTGARLLAVDEARFVYLVSHQPAFALAVMGRLARTLRGAPAPEAPAPDAAARPGGFQVTEIRPGLLQLRSLSRAANAYLVVGARRRVLVDTGFASTFPALAAALAAAGHPVGTLDMCVLTHEHADHAAGVGCLPRAVTVAAHPMAAAKIVNGDDMATVRDLFREDAPPAHVDLMLQEGSVVSVPPWRFEVVHAPGHTSGSIALHDAASGTLIAGDTVLAGGALGGIFGSGNVSDYVLTLERLAGLRPRLLLPGHGPVSETATEDLVAALAQARLLLAETRDIFAAVGATAEGFAAMLRSARALARYSTIRPE